MGAEIQWFETGETRELAVEEVRADAASKVVTVSVKPYLVPWYTFKRKNPFTNAIDDIQVLEFDEKSETVKLRVTTTKLGPKENTIPLDRYENLHDTKI